MQTQGLQRRTKSIFTSFLHDPNLKIDTDTIKKAYKARDLQLFSQEKDLTETSASPVYRQNLRYSASPPSPADQSLTQQWNKLAKESEWITDKTDQKGLSGLDLTYSQSTISLFSPNASPNHSHSHSQRVRTVSLMEKSNTSKKHKNRTTEELFCWRTLKLQENANRRSSIMARRQKEHNQRISVRLERSDPLYSQFLYSQLEKICQEIILGNEHNRKLQKMNEHLSKQLTLQHEQALLQVQAPVSFQCKPQLGHLGQRTKFIATGQMKQDPIVKNHQPRHLVPAPRQNDKENHYRAKAAINRKANVCSPIYNSSSDISAQSPLTATRFNIVHSKGIHSELDRRITRNYMEDHYRKLSSTAMR